MALELDFYFDFGSPTAYLAYQRLLQLEQQYPLNISYKPALLGGIFKATGNSSPIAVPAKGQYMNQHDMPRFCQRYGVKLEFNPHFPINTLNLMRGAFVAQELNCFDQYLAVVFQAMWQDQKNMGDLSVLTEVLQQGGLDASAIVEGSQRADIKACLIDATEAAVGRGLFGAPTMFIGDEMFFGQDRLDFIEERLQG